MNHDINKIQQSHKKIALETAIPFISYMVIFWGLIYLLFFGPYIESFKFSKAILVLRLP